MSDLKELSDAMDRFVRAKGWYDASSPRQQTPRNIAISLCLEAAEVMEHYQWSNTSANQKELASELADVALYLLQLARINGIDLEQAIYDKLEQNYQRSWE
jgi:NTP pyrophosphatase (non-canonical NTP hydrolase)